MAKTSINATGLTVFATLLAGCGLVPGERNVHIERFDIDAKTVAVGESFQVTWKVQHHAHAGDIYWYGLYLADDAQLEALGQLFSNDDEVPKFFARGDLAHDDPGHLSCTRDSAQSVRCTPFGKFSGMSLTGRHTITLRACLSYVLSDTDTCDSREVVVDFP